MGIIDQILSTKSTSELKIQASYICNSPELLSEIIDTFLGHDTMTTQKCAHILSFISDQRPDLISPHIGKLIQTLYDSPCIAVKRNIVRVLQCQEIPEEYQGQLAEQCFNYLTSQEPVAVKVFSMTILGNLCTTYPELSNELHLIINDLMINGSPGIISRGKKVLKQIESIKH